MRFIALRAGGGSARFSMQCRAVMPVLLPGRAPARLGLPSGLSSESPVSDAQERLGGVQGADRSPEGQNLLGGCGSLYLRQHARDPVPWRPFGPEVFEEARRLDRPVLLSSGYASCHWCHVMHRETFQDLEVADFLRRHFVCVKVDREERPDVDAVYLKAVEAMTGQAGWPLTVFLTPEGHPFFGGTYFPRGAFLALCARVADLWTHAREEVRGQASRVAEALRSAGVPSGQEAASKVGWDDVLGPLCRAFDPIHGGLGGPMKFPQAPVLDLCATLLYAMQDQELRVHVERTLTAMARGGIRDAVGGGFHRYATRPDWSVPHFEKMLYDQAALLRLFACAAREGGRGSAWVARDTAAFLLRDMRRPDGLFAASIDADDPIGEGAYYRWTLAEMAEVLGAKDGGAVWDLLAGAEDPSQPGAYWLDTRRVVSDESRALVERARPALLRARSKRPAPARDDKAVLEWNAMTIGALSRAGALLGDSEWIEAAVRANSVLRKIFRPADHVLARAHNAGPPDGVVTPQDLAQWGLACLDLHAATGDLDTLCLAQGLALEAMQRFLGPEGRLYLVPDTRGDLPERPLADAVDHPTPSAVGALLRLLVRLEMLEGPMGPLARAADALLGQWLRWAHRRAHAAPWTLLAAWERATGWMGVLAGDLRDGRASALARAFLHKAPPDALLVIVPPKGLPEGSDLAQRFPALLGHKAVSGRPTLSVCKAGTCHPPVFEPKDLLAPGESR